MITTPKSIVHSSSRHYLRQTLFRHFETLESRCLLSGTQAEHDLASITNVWDVLKNCIVINAIAICSDDMAAVNP